MKHQWRLFHLLLRAQKSIPNPSQIPRSFTSIPNRFTPNSTFPINPSFRCFSSELAVAQPDSDLYVIFDIFFKPRDLDDVNNRIELNHVSINHDAINAVLWKLVPEPEPAKRFFQWLTENHPEKLSSKSYNAMLAVLGANGFVGETCDLIGIMKTKGYGVTKFVRKRVLECFEKEDDVKKLKDLLDNKSDDRVFSSVCRIVRNNVWSEDVEKQIRDLNVVFRSEFVMLVLENLASEPNKALIFFLWLEESEVFKHDGSTYNATARVLGREDSIDRFWKLVGDMRSAGFEMEVETYVKVLGRFCKRRMVKDAVELYEFAMAGEVKPSPLCGSFLLKKVVSSKELDVDLFQRALKVFTGNGNVLTDSLVEDVLKSLTSVGRVGEWKDVLKEIEDCGFVPSAKLRNRIAFRLGAAGHKEKANEFVSRIEETGSNPDHRTWQCLVEGHCVGGNLDEAFESFKKMVEKEGVASAGYAFDLLVSSYCKMNRAIVGCKILCQFVKKKELKPRHSTYKTLVTQLLAQGGFTYASDILGLMRDHGFPPFTDPFFEHISKHGSGDEAVLFLQAMTSKKFPSTSVYLKMFDAFFQQGRHEEAQNFLSKCPGYIRNHADVLDLFCSMNSKEAASSEMLPA